MLDRVRRKLDAATGAAAANRATVAATEAATAATEAAAAATGAVTAATGAANAAVDATEAVGAMREHFDAITAPLAELAPWANHDGRHVRLDYPVHPRARFGHGQPPHPQLTQILTERTAAYRDHLGAIGELTTELQHIAVDDPGSPGAAYWRNAWLPGLDAAALYTMVTRRDPVTYLEVGSGTSTKFARRAIEDHGLRTRIVSIDPHPRSEIDALCDQVVRSPLENADLSVFDEVGAGDVVFIDNSHRVLPNSDATVFFLEVLPRLAPGVMVEIHDIYLPEDYPSYWGDRYWSEQYVLAAYLLGGGRAFSTELPNWFVCRHAELNHVMAPMWDTIPGAERHGTSFWLEVS